MAKITLSEVIANVGKDKWIVVSKEYKNLNEIMHFQCEEGHDVYAPYKQVREKRVCPICADNVLKSPTKQVVTKKRGVVRRLALDQATNTTGWSVFDDTTLVKYGTFSAKGDDAIARTAIMKTWLHNMIVVWEPDEIGFEDIQLQAWGAGSARSVNNVAGLQTYKTLAHLQGTLMVLAHELDIKYRLCPTPTWRSFCGVKGRSRADKKASIKYLIKQWYDITVNEDEADAIGIGHYLSNSKEVIDKKMIKPDVEMIQF